MTRERELLDALDQARRDGDRLAECRLRVELGEDTPLLSTNFERVGWWLLEAQELAEALEAGDLEGRARLRLGELRRRSGGAAEALEAAREAGADPELAARAAVLEAHAAIDLRDLQTAAAAMDVVDVTTPMGGLAHARLLALEDVEAGREALAAVPHATDPGDRFEQLLALAGWSLVAGDAEAATAGVEEAARIAESLSSPHEAVVCGALFAVAAMTERRYAAALEALAGVVRTCGELDPVWSDEEPPEGRGHPLLCLAGVRSAREAVVRLVQTGEARGKQAASLDFVLCSLAAATFLYAGDDPAEALAVCEEVAGALEGKDRAPLARPLRALAEALRAAP